MTEYVRCTYCGGTHWHEGPRGGMCVNICCANPECRHWFNLCMYLGHVIRFDDLHRAEPLCERD